MHMKFEAYHSKVFLSYILLLAGYNSAKLPLLCRKAQRTNLLFSPGAGALSWCLHCLDTSICWRSGFSAHPIPYHANPILQQLTRQSSSPATYTMFSFDGPNCSSCMASKTALAVRQQIQLRCRCIFLEKHNAAFSQSMPLPGGRL